MSELPTDTVMGRDITLFVACYNEEEGIIPTLNTLLAALAEVGCTYDIVIVDDASTDGSAPIIKQFMTQRPRFPSHLSSTSSIKAWA